MKRRRVHPLQLLLRKIRVAAAQINEASARRIAAYYADSLPQTRAELTHGPRGDVACRARAMMRALPTMAPEDYPQTQSDLRACADALESSFVETSFTSMGKRRRGEARPAL